MRKLLALVRRLRIADHSGIAMTEFALILPFVLLIGFVGIETANYVLTYFEISQIAMTVADNAGRVRTNIDETDVDQLMIGAFKMGQNINFATKGRIILSDLEMRTSLGAAGPTTIVPWPYDNLLGFRQWIRWQRCAGAQQFNSSYGYPLDVNGNQVTNLNSTATDDGAVETKSALLGMGPASPVPIQASSNTAVMFVEIYYVYTPIVPLGLLSNLAIINNLTMHTTEAFNVRQRTQYSVTNSTPVTGNYRADCTLYSATVPAGVPAGT